MQIMACQIAVDLLRRRLCDPTFVYSAFKSSPNGNYSKLKLLISNTIVEACNNSVLLIGPRGCGMREVVDIVLEELKCELLEIISVVRLNGLLHTDDNCAMKEIARQLCMEHKLIFSKTASFDDNSQFIIDMLRECGLAHKMIIFVMDEFDLFTQGNQRLLYSLLDAMQTLTSHSIVMGISCNTTADQLLEKRVRSRFSHRKLVFTPPSTEDMQRLLEHILYLPKNSTLPSNYVEEFNFNVHVSFIIILAMQRWHASLYYFADAVFYGYNTLNMFQNILADKKFRKILDALLFVDNSISIVLGFLFQAVSRMYRFEGIAETDRAEHLTLADFEYALSCIRRQPTLDKLQDASFLELYILVCLNRLESKEQNSCNFNSIIKEHKAIQDAHKISGNYSRSVCLLAFRHLLERNLISFSDNQTSMSIECRPVILLPTSKDLYQGLEPHAKLQELVIFEG